MSMSENYTCGECGKEFDSKRGLHIHIGQTHPDKKEKLLAEEKEESKKKESKTEVSEEKKPEKSGGFFSSKKNVVAGVGALAVIIVAAMLLFNFTGMLNGERASGVSSDNETAQLEGDVVATVNGEAITSSEVNRIRQQITMTGQNVTREQMLEQLVDHEILKQQAEKEGYEVSVEEAEQRLESQLGQGMKLEDLKQRVKQQGASWENQIEIYQEQFALRDYIEETVTNQIGQVTEEEIQQYYRTLKQQSQQELPPLENIKQKVKASVQQQKRQEVISSLIRQLKPQYDIVYK